MERDYRIFENKKKKKSVILTKTNKEISFMAKMTNNKLGETIVPESQNS